LVRRHGLTTRREEGDAHHPHGPARRRLGAGARRAGRRRRPGPVVPAAEQPRLGPEEAEGPVQDAPREQAYKTIQSAVAKAKPGDTIRIADGTYRESVRINGPSKRFIKLVGNVEDPHKVVLEGEGKRQNGVTVNGADAVTIRGIKARRFKANGFFAVNVTGYAMDRLIAELPGTTRSTPRAGR
jgi:hypothetical protein